MRSILLHIDDDDCLEARLQVALDLARSFDGHVDCCQAVSYIVGIPGDLYGTMAAELVPAIRKAADALRDRIEARLAREDVAWSWNQSDGPALERLLESAALSDLAVVSNCDPLSNSPSPLPGALAMRLRTPILLVPKSAAGFDSGGPALVAWDGSPEACRALRAATPLLARAQTVALASVAEEGERRFDLPPTEGAEYLSRHGIACQLVELPAGGKSTAEVLVEAAAMRNAAYLIMGVYGHARLVETIWGGVTRELFAEPPLPVVACH